MSRPETATFGSSSPLLRDGRLVFNELFINRSDMNREFNIFLKAFDQGREDQMNIAVLDLNEKLKHLRKVSSSLEENKDLFSDIVSSANKMTEICQIQIRKEVHYQEERENTHVHQQAAREKDMSNFLLELDEKRKHIDQQHEDLVTRITSQYDRQE
eukprot:TRINITY_DN3246_c0_g1_i1.p1 TRINITY_DN3246_c0_g1~~TRINITY_DN3246_c0_g1_i1.p1  ORF type:complete len:157 (-),score=41.49 TRINITY_DN3246_c0_g1_i1:81-551(-)